MKKKLILIFTIVISMLFITTLNALTPEEFYNMSEAKRQEALNGMDGKSRMEFLAEYEEYLKELEITPEEFYNMTEDEKQKALDKLNGRDRQAFLAEYEAYKKELEIKELTPEKFFDMSEEERQKILSEMDGYTKQKFLAKYNTYKKNLTPQEFINLTEEQKQEILSGMSTKEKQLFLDEVVKLEKQNGNSSDPNETIKNPNDELLNPDINKNNNGANNNSGGSSSGSTGVSSSSGLSGWCSKLNSVWFILGRILQVIYVATPLLLIVTGAITFLQAMTNKDSSAISKAQQALVKKIIAAVLIFLLLPITKLSLKLVADEGWYDCAKCVFSPDESCKSGDVTTG